MNTRCGMEQWLARRAHNPKVAGSNPAPATSTTVTTETERLKTMTPKLSHVIQHGTKEWSHLTGDEKEIETFARRLHVPVHGAGNGKGRDPHLDLTPHQRELAKRYGAQEAEDE